ncbi:MAG: TIR domain-containing protein [Methylococcaceae bacterium]|nr:TIR domain-containing protein [Methylococcaceae bacterium]
MAFLKNVQHDVFISYAHNDNIQNWVVKFKEQLYQQVKTKLGDSQELDIFFDDQMQPNHAIEKCVTAAGQSALFLAITSPSYVSSDWTQKEYLAFAQNNTAEDCLFAIELLPIDKEKLNSYPKLAGKKRTHFYKTIAHKVQQTLKPTSAAFTNNICIIAEHICQQLKTLATPVSPPTTKTTYVPNCHYDVVISHNEKDAEWANNLCGYLRKQLQRFLSTYDGIQIIASSDDNLADSTATLLAIATPAYYQQHKVESAAFNQLAKQKALFLVEYEPCKHAGSLNGPTRHKFWVDDDQLGIIPMTDAAYYVMADKLALLVAEQLKATQQQWQSHQRLAQEQTRQQIEFGGVLNSMIMVCSAPEDTDLLQTVEQQLRAHKIGHVPIVNSEQIMNKDIIATLGFCDALLILYVKSDTTWLKRNLTNCYRYSNGLKIYAVHQDANKPELGIYIPNLKTYICPPKEIETYLPEFIQALNT